MLRVWSDNFRVHIFSFAKQYADESTMFDRPRKFLWEFAAADNTYLRIVVCQTYSIQNSRQCTYSRINFVLRVIMHDEIQLPRGIGKVKAEYTWGSFTLMRPPLLVLWKNRQLECNHEVNINSL